MSLEKKHEKDRKGKGTHRLECGLILKQHAPDEPDDWSSFSIS